MPTIRLIEARLPDFGVGDQPPPLGAAIYAGRFAALEQARASSGLDALVVYADREHFANLAWLTGFDPRFEEALLVQTPGRTPVLLAGPENLGRAANAAIAVEARLYPPFGLLGQDRSRTERLADLLTAAGIAAGQHIGVVAGSISAATKRHSLSAGSRRRPSSSTRCAASPEPRALWSMPTPC